ncbi:DUF2244 domain-containing protein [Marinobacter sp.]|uniref:DUF2244 domain-containing protein n=1 Tax=Marinobacter sp. TaxID=50741 RepID=UPI0034A3E171
MVEHLECDNGVRLLLTPNRSLTWRGNVRFWFALFAVSLMISTGMVLAGAWVIAPFAGLELIALAAGIYYTARACQSQEVFAVSADTFRLEQGRRTRQREWRFPRRYTRVRVELPRHAFTPAKLFLCHRDQDVALGAFLNVEDTQILLRILEGKGVPLDRRSPAPDIGFWY